MLVIVCLTQPAGNPPLRFFRGQRKIRTRPVSKTVSLLVDAQAFLALFSVMFNEDEGYPEIMCRTASMATEERLDWTPPSRWSCNQNLGSWSLSCNTRSAAREGVMWRPI